MSLISKRFYADAFFIALAITLGTGVSAYFSSNIHERNAKMEFQKAPLMQAANANSAAVVALDARGKISVWNEGATRLFGWSESEMLGRDISRLADSGAIPMHAQAYQKSMEGGCPTAKEVTCVARRKDGTSFEINIMVMTAPPQGAVAIIVDDSKVTRTDMTTARVTRTNSARLGALPAGDAPEPPAPIQLLPQ